MGDTIQTIAEHAFERAQALKVIAERYPDARWNTIGGRDLLTSEKAHEDIEDFEIVGTSDKTYGGTFETIILGYVTVVDRVRVYGLRRPLFITSGTVFAMNLKRKDPETYAGIIAFLKTGA